MRLTLVTHLMTAATRRAAVPDDEPIDVSGALPVLVRPGSIAVRGPELRCAQTCAPLGLDASVHPGLADWDLGRWRGRTLADIADDEPDATAAWLADASAAPHGGESLDALLARVGTWLDGTGAASTIAVTSPAVVRAVVVVALGVPAAAFWRLDVAPGTSTTLSGRDGRWNVASLGAPLR